MQFLFTLVKFFFPYLLCYVMDIMSSQIFPSILEDFVVVVFHRLFQLPPGQIFLLFILFFALYAIVICQLMVPGQFIISELRMAV